MLVSLAGLSLLQPSALRIGAPNLVSRSARSAVVCKEQASAVVNDEDTCYLFDTEEGRKYVCTENPEELAWHMGLDMSDLKQGPKPDDLELIECAEEWSHTGTPQWACKEAPEVEDEGCEMIGETDDEVWFTCKDGADAANVDCEGDNSFGVGGGPVRQPSIELGPRSCLAASRALLANQEVGARSRS